jgi:ATP-binding cassette subfamily B protein
MKKNVLTWIWNKNKKALGGIIFLTVLSIILAAASLAFSLVSKEAVDTAVSGSGSMVRVFTSLAVLLLIQLVVQTVTTITNVSVQSSAEISMRRSLFSSLMKKDFLSVVEYHSAELMNRLNSDVSVICSFTVNIIPALALFMTKIIAGLVLLFFLDKVFALAMLVFAPLMLLFASLYRKRFKQLHIKCQESDGRTRAFMQEALQNLLVIKSFLAEKRMVKASDRLQLENFNYKIKRTIVSVFANIGMFILFNAGYYFALAWGAYRMQQNIITAGTVFAIVTLIGQIQSPLKELSSVVPQFYAMWASAERLIELEKIKDDHVENVHIDYSKISEIVFDGVSFSYSADAGVENLSMRIKKGGVTAIAGESGVGKSTAMKLILGIMRPDKGAIYFKTDGGNIEIDGKTRGMFAYVPQGNMILSGTIRENIAFAKTAAPEQQIIDAAKAACIWDFIETLDNGLDTHIGEKGIGLSEGQVQRLAIARAIMYGAPILLFDEATSALDEQTERSVLENIKALPDRMCVIISHKQTVLDVCDDVIYLGRRQNGA